MTSVAVHEAVAPMALDDWTGSWVGAPSEGPALGAWQLARAWDVVDRCRANPFYRDRLPEVADRSAHGFTTLPTTTKDDVVEDCNARPPYGSRNTCEPGDVVAVVETSGTTGRGREIYTLDAGDEAAILRTEAVGFWWAGVRPGWRVLLTFPVGTAAAGQWFYGGLKLLGASVFSVGAHPIDRKVETLARFGADLVIGTPSYVQRLGHACLDAGIPPADVGVRALLIGGEPYTPTWARRLAELWHAPLFEQYGCTERAIAWACPVGVLSGDSDELGVLHFPADNAYVEVVDSDAGEHVGDGEWGELIVTPLRAQASPLVRFATRDRVQWRAPGACRCGRPLGGITAGSVQRYDDMVKVRGVNLWPRAVDAVVLGVAGVEDYRATISRTDRGEECIDVAVEPADGAPADVVARVEDAVAGACGLRVRAALTAPGAITGSVPEGFTKVKRWSDQRNAAPVART